MYQSSSEGDCNLCGNKTNQFGCVVHLQPNEGLVTLVPLTVYICLDCYAQVVGKMSSMWDENFSSAVFGNQSMTSV